MCVRSICTIYWLKGLRPYINSDLAWLFKEADYVILRPTLRIASNNTINRTTGFKFYYSDVYFLFQALAVAGALWMAKISREEHGAYPWNWKNILDWCVLSLEDWESKARTIILKSTKNLPVVYFVTAASPLSRFLLL